MNRLSQKDEQRDDSDWTHAESVYILELENIEQAKKRLAFARNRLEAMANGHSIQGPLLHVQQVAKSIRFDLASFYKHCTWTDPTSGEMVPVSKGLMNSLRQGARYLKNPQDMDATVTRITKRKKR